MKLTDIEITLGEHLASAGIADLQLLFPNVVPDPDPPVAPYAVISVSPDRVETLSLDGTVNITSGRLLVVVVVKENKGTIVAGQIRDQIAGLFPPGLRISGATGSIEFRRAPQPKPGYAQGGNWRVPLEIPFSA